MMASADRTACAKRRRSPAVRARSLAPGTSNTARSCTVATVGARRRSGTSTSSPCSKIGLPDRRQPLEGPPDAHRRSPHQRPYAFGQLVHRIGLHDGPKLPVRTVPAVKWASIWRMYVCTPLPSGRSARQLKVMSGIGWRPLR